MKNSQLVLDVAKPLGHRVPPRVGVGAAADVPYQRIVELAYIQGTGRVWVGRGWDDVACNLPQYKAHDCHWLGRDWARDGLGLGRGACVGRWASSRGGIPTRLIVAYLGEGPRLEVGVRRVWMCSACQIWGRLAAPPHPKNSCPRCHNPAHRWQQRWCSNAGVAFLSHCTHRAAPTRSCSSGQRASA